VADRGRVALVSGLPTGYRDRVIVTRGQSTGHQDPVTYEWVPGDEDTVVLDSEANVQAGGLIAANRRSVSTTYADADGVAYFPQDKLGDLMDVVPDDVVTVLYAPIPHGTLTDWRQASATAVFVRPEDRALLLRYT
jgi:hypothetical protein